MNCNSRWLQKIMFAGTLTMVAPCSSIMADDSSADVDGGFNRLVRSSEAVMIRVPINDRGQENTGAAEIRVHQGDGQVGAPQDFVTAWDSSQDGSNQPVQSLDDSDTSDSSTWWWGWRAWRHHGWYNNYYYSYRPAYFYYGNYYSYSTPYYYNNYYGYTSPVYGYRYYYYPRYW